MARLASDVRQTELDAEKYSPKTRLWRAAAAAYEETVFIMGRFHPRR